MYCRSVSKVESMISSCKQSIIAGKRQGSRKLRINNVQTQRGYFYAHVVPGTAYDYK